MLKAMIGGAALALGLWVGGAAAEPKLGIGLSGIADWSAANPFLDLMKTSRPWVGSSAQQWGAWDNARLAEGGYLSPEGWPREAPGDVVRFDTLVLTDQADAASSLAGTYLLRWTGSGHVYVQGLVEDVTEADHSLSFTYQPGQGAVLISVEDLDPADPLGDMTLVRQDRLELFDGGAMFNPDFLDRIRDFRALRFMDWMATNNSVETDWAERPLVDDASWMPQGVPVEIMVRLANEVGADAWFTMPHAADDAYVLAFAEYVRDHLDPRLKAHVEWSNEVWNWMFSQARWAEEQAQVRWNAAPGGDAWMQFAGLRAAEVADLWGETFGEQAEDRLVRVVSVHTGWLGLETPLLEAPLAVAEGLAPPVESFDAYAVTGYFGYAIGGEETAPALREWIEQGRAEDEVTALARADLGHLTSELWPYHARIARDHGLRLVAYEGGTHIVGHGAVMNDQQLTDFFTAYSYSPQMGHLYQDLLASWEEVGGTLFMHYADVAGPSKFGSWGALRHLDDRNPRWDALIEESAALSSWEEREPGTFAQGVQITGSEAADTLSGTPEEDDLLGGEGDDILISEGGADRLNGGGGRDQAVIPGAAADWSMGADGAATILSNGAMTIRLTDVEEVLFAGTGEVLSTPPAP